MNIAEIDQQLTVLPQMRVELIAQIEAAKQRLDSGDQNAALQIVALNEQVSSVARQEAGLEIDRRRAEYEARQAEYDQAVRKLRSKQKSAKKLWANEAQARNAYISAFAAMATADQELDSLTEQVNRLAALTGHEPEIAVNPTVEATQGVIAGLLSTALVLSSENDKRKYPALGIAQKAKLAVDALLADGTVLTGEQIGMLENMFITRIRAEQSTYDAVQFDKLIGKAAQYLKEAKAVRPPVSTGFVDSERMLRSGIPQAVINGVSAQVNKFIQQLTNQQEPEPMTEAEQAEFAEKARRNSTAINFWPGMRF